MVNITFETINSSLIYAIERQQAIAGRVQEPGQPQLLEMIEEQTRLLEVTLRLFNRIT